MNHITYIVSSAIAICRRFTQYLTSHSKGMDSTQQIQGNRNAAVTSTYVNVLPSYGTLRARASQRLTASPSGLARWVALVIGISLSMPMAVADSGSIEPIITLKQLADYQLTDEQYKCHNAIVYRESRWVADAQNGSHHGYYQGRSTALIGKSDEYQFMWYWSYVSHRYGITSKDEPNYCNALAHLTRYNWQ